jgi:F420-dependent oxidoreductase-like protein
VKIALQLGYWGAHPPTNDVDLVDAAERSGYDAVFTAESWGSDAYTPLAWLGRSTSRLRLGTSVVQMSARTPTACAMAAMTLDHLSGGRHVLGLGVSGPQVVEGWYGQPFPKPLARTREYIDVVRQVWARQAPVVNAGPHYPLPLTGAGTTGVGKSLNLLPTPCVPTSPSFSVQRDPRTSRWPPRSPTVGCPSSIVRAWPRCTTSGSTRVSLAPALDVTAPPSRSAPPHRS